MAQKTARDRLTPWCGKDGFFGAVQIMHIICFHISYFPKPTVNTLIEDIFLYNIIL